MAGFWNSAFFLKLPYVLKSKYALPSLELQSFIALDVGSLKGKRLVLADLDNTLAKPSSTELEEDVLKKIQEIKEAGIYFAVLSNHAGNKDDKEKRGESISEKYSIDVLKSRHKKPAKEAFLPHLQKYKALPEETVFIGDRVFTDILGANLLQIESVLVKPLDSSLDPWFVKLVRIFENTILALHKK
ncbi:YqeG family HAD IIIA-type phosphatase [Candidatus Woesearchaeota archaeon]|nr:YqeG family HAD IIIA-type phosphatase [Candidatus Woesearchaeota archaeon]